MKKTLMVGSAAVALGAITAPILALDIDFSGRSRFNMTGGETTFSDLNVNYAVPNANTPNAVGFVAGNLKGAMIVPAAGVVAAAAAAATTGNLSNAASAQGFIINGGAPVDIDPMFSNDERLHVNIDETTCCFTYGGMLRLEDANIKSDIYLAGDWGRLDFGNIDNARSGAFDVSIYSAGPLTPGTGVSTINLVSNKTVNMVKTENRVLAGFDGSTVGATGVVYTGNAFAGFTPKIGFDGSNAEIGIAGSLGPLGLMASVDDENRYGVVLTGKVYNIDLAGFAGEDDDNDSYMGAVAKWTSASGKLAVSLAGSVAEGDDSIAATFSPSLGVPPVGPVAFSAKETDIIGGISYRIATGLTASASVRSQELKTTTGTGPGYNTSASATDYAARLQLDF